MRKKHLGLVAAALVLLGASLAHADGDDVVFLKSGGRLRGTVMAEDPKEGVQVKLATGEVKTVAAGDLDHVQYADRAAPKGNNGPPSGALHVDAGAPGQVFLDGGLVGRAPADVASTVPGVHRVRVEFDQGGKREQEILVQAGEVAKVRLEVPMAAVGFREREGVNFGVGAEGNLILFPSFGGRALAFGGGSAEFVINVALTPAVDLRATAFAGVTQGDATFIPVGGSFGARFNFGSWYSLGTGFRGGVAISSGSNGTTVLPMFGPELSPFGVRLGSKRELSIELVERVGLYDDHGFFFGTTEHAVRLEYLFL